MTKQVYTDLREQLDQYSVGYPSTKSGIELRILERLFTVEQAEMFLHLSLMLETPEAVAQRTGREAESIAELLEEMARRGLLFRHRKGEVVKYCAVPFVVGAYEFQLKHIDRELAQMFEVYFEEAFLDRISESGSPLRTIPVNSSFDARWPVAPYEDAKTLIKGHDTIAVAECLCRVQKKLVDEPCDKALEVCMVFGSHAKFYVENEMARFVSQEEALAVLEACEEAGLVHQPFNSKLVGGMCNCCGDCCAALRALKRQARPIDSVVTNYFARSDPESCSACEICIERCQMDAIKIDADEVSQVDRDRCIGCGLCVTTCPSHSMILERVPEAEQRVPPGSGRAQMTEMAAKRGTSLFPLSMTKG